MFGETPVFHLKIWNHQIETTIFWWMFSQGCWEEEPESQDMIRKFWFQNSFAAGQVWSHPLPGIFVVVLLMIQQKSQAAPFEMYISLYDIQLLKNHG